MDYSIIGFIFTVLPLFVVIIVFRWIRFIYQNSEKQVEQNEKIIELLMEIKEQNKRSLSEKLDSFYYLISILISLTNS